MAEGMMSQCAGPCPCSTVGNTGYVFALAGNEGARQQWGVQATPAAGMQVRMQPVMATVWLACPASHSFASVLPLLHAVIQAGWLM